MGTSWTQVGPHSQTVLRIHPGKWSFGKLPWQPQSAPDIWTPSVLERTFWTEMWGRSRVEPSQCGPTGLPTGWCRDVSSLCSPRFPTVCPVSAHCMCSYCSHAASLDVPRCACYSPTRCRGVSRRCRAVTTPCPLLCQAVTISPTPTVSYLSTVSSPRHERPVPLA